MAVESDSSPAPDLVRRPDRPRQLQLTDAHRRIEREVRPPMRRAGRRGRPPQLQGMWPLADGAKLCASRPGDPTPDRGLASFRALLRDARQKGADFRLPVPAVTAERPDRRELSCLCPPGHSLRVNPEHRGNFRRGKQRFCLWCTCRHVDGLSSWTGTAIPIYFCCCSRLLAKPASDVLYSPLRPYCHHQP
jgi:hypothetical protein